MLPVVVVGEGCHIGGVFLVVCVLMIVVYVVMVGGIAAVSVSVFETTF